MYTKPYGTCFDKEGWSGQETHVGQDQWGRVGWRLAQACITCSAKEKN